MRERCVGAVITDGAARLLLVQRGRPPDAGRWSVPGGRVEPGETDEDAVLREVREETGLFVRVGAPLGSVVRDGPDATYDIHDYAAIVCGGKLRAGDDAADARWVDRARLSSLPLVTGLLATLTEWHALPEWS